jgi:hypothetical protein
VISFSYWSIKQWFHTEGKLTVVLIIPSSWGFPTDPVIHQDCFWRCCRGGRGFLQGEFLTSNLFTLLLFCLVSLLYFVRFFFIKNSKKLVPTIVVIFVGLILSCFLLALSCFLSMVDFFETRSYWQGGFTEEQKKYYKEHRLSQKGNTYGNKLINCISLLETCALLIMLLIALINLVVVGGINSSLFNVIIMIMLPYLLMLREIMTFMMWNKLKNLLLGRMHSTCLFA